MAEQQPFGEPVPYASLATPPLSLRPGSVTVIAILAIVFGSLGVLVCLCSIPSLLLNRTGVLSGSGMNYNATVTRSTTTTNGATTVTTTNANPFSPQSFAYMREPTFIIYSVANALVFLLLWICAIWAGIGLLKMYPAARVWIIRYAVVDLILSIARLIFYITVLQPKIMASMQSVMSQAGAGNPMVNMMPMMNVGMYIGDGFSVLLLSWPIAILIFMSRPHVKAAFGDGLRPKF